MLQKIFITCLAVNLFSSNARQWMNLYGVITDDYLKTSCTEITAVLSAPGREHKQRQLFVQLHQVSTNLYLLQEFHLK